MTLKQRWRRFREDNIDALDLKGAPARILEHFFPSPGPPLELRNEPRYDGIYRDHQGVPIELSFSQYGGDPGWSGPTGQFKLIRHYQRGPAETDSGVWRAAEGSIDLEIIDAAGELEWTSGGPITPTELHLTTIWNPNRPGAQMAYKTVARLESA